MKLLLILFLTFSSILAKSQYHRTHSVKVDTSINGNITKKVEEKTKESKSKDPLEYIRIVKTKTYYYDSLGNVYFEMLTVRKYGKNFGKTCHLIKQIQTEYYPSGKKARKDYFGCDCKKTYSKIYNRNGKIITKEKRKVVRVYSKVKNKYL